MEKGLIVIFHIFLFILYVTFVYGEEFQIRILHANDFHGFAEPYKPIGSSERVSSWEILLPHPSLRLKT